MCVGVFSTFLNLSRPLSRPLSTSLDLSRPLSTSLDLSRRSNLHKSRWHIVGQDCPELMAAWQIGQALWRGTSPRDALTAYSWSALTKVFVAELQSKYQPAWSDHWVKQDCCFAFVCVLD